VIAFIRFEFLKRKTPERLANHRRKIEALAEIICLAGDKAWSRATGPDGDTGKRLAS
jgi:hypothetical protein